MYRLQSLHPSRTTYWSLLDCSISRIQSRASHNLTQCIQCSTPELRECGCVCECVGGGGNVWDVWGDVKLVNLVLKYVVELIKTSTHGEWNALEAIFTHAHLHMVWWPVDVNFTPPDFTACMHIGVMILITASGVTFEGSSQMDDQHSGYIAVHFWTARSGHMTCHMTS